MTAAIRCRPARPGVEVLYGAVVDRAEPDAAHEKAIAGGPVGDAVGLAGARKALDEGGPGGASRARP